MFNGPMRIQAGTAKNIKARGRATCGKDVDEDKETACEHQLLSRPRWHEGPQAGHYLGGEGSAFGMVEEAGRTVNRRLEPLGKADEGFPSPLDWLAAGGVGAH